MRTSEKIIIASEVTATTTTDAIPFSDIERATLEIQSAGTFNNRSGVIVMSVSIDGDNYVDYAMLIPNIVNTNSQQLTRVTATTAVTTTSQDDLYIIDDMMPFKFAKFTLTVTDGASPTGNFTINLYKKYR